MSIGSSKSNFINHHEVLFHFQDHFGKFLFGSKNLELTVLDKIADLLIGVRGVVCVLWQGNNLPILAPSTLNFFGLNQTGESRGQFTLSPEELPKTLNLLRIFSQEKKLFVIFYNAKPMFSYAGWCLEKQNLSPNVITLPECGDLFLRERFLGIDKAAPTSCREAVKRLSECKAGRKIHQEVHLPLIPVISDLERSGLIKKDVNKIVYPFYQIEGQANGRMNCTSPSDDNYNPHLIDDELKAQILPQGYDINFIMADFRALEFVVLSHLSEDDNMIADSNSDDPYLAALRRMFGKSDISAEHRDMAKNIFLPVFYGKSPPVLARDLNCSRDFAESVHQEMRIMYPKAFRLVSEAERTASEKGFCEDYLGRRRYFEDKFMAARNMVVQAPSAMFCQERLIDMHQVIRVGAKVHASIHDGFLMSCKVSETKEIIKYVKLSLETESQLIPGLRAKVRISCGTGLDNLSQVADTGEK